MPDCKHESVEYVGEQKTDDGVNSYYRCKACGTLLVRTPANRVYGIQGIQTSHTPHKSDS
jgi:hypothetical protein